MDKLVYYEIFQDELQALQRENTIKKWPREWKKNAIEKENPEWLDLYDRIIK